MNPARLADLRAQARAAARTGYDGHNRHPVGLSWAMLGHRRARRRWHRWLAAMVRGWAG